MPVGKGRKPMPRRCKDQTNPLHTQQMQLKQNKIRERQHLALEEYTMCMPIWTANYSFRCGIMTTLIVMSDPQHKTHLEHGGVTYDGSKM
jgi:hypothetical protein